MSKMRRKTLRTTRRLPQKMRRTSKSQRTSLPSPRHLKRIARSK